MSTLTLRILLPVAQTVGRIGLAILDRLYPIDTDTPTGRTDR